MKIVAWLKVFAFLGNNIVTKMLFLRSHFTWNTEKGAIYFLLWIPHLKPQGAPTEAPRVRLLKGGERKKIIQVLVELSGEEQSGPPIVGLLELTQGEREGKSPLVGLLEISLGERERRNPAARHLVFDGVPLSSNSSLGNQEEDFFSLFLSRHVTVLNSMFLMVRN